ncbi:MAG: DNA gyrase C-terminal beta-propeller domain-containing protein [candidate division KSB1 bacterium]|nr:DNA gyrase C-terminal beta-propeller domain-containing protein [candidate division KSB1 bacterium]
MTLKDKDYVIGARLTSGKQDVIMATREGMSIRFSEENVRDMGLTASGVRGITLGSSDRVISLIALEKKNGKLLTVTNLGYGKRSELSEYRPIHRGGKGIITYKLSDKVGKLAAVVEVQNQDTVLFITQKGKVKRQRAKGISIMGRATQGEAMVNISKTDEIVRAIQKPEDKFQDKQV